MATIEAGRIQIPYITTFRTEDPHPPSRKDPDGPIMAKLNAKLQDPTAHILRVGKHATIDLDSISAHSKFGSGVRWLPQIQENMVVPWKNPQSWETLLADREFLSAFQEEALIQVAAGIPFYSQFGWSAFTQTPREGFTKQGGKTIQREHWHFHPRIDLKHIEDYVDGYITPYANMTSEEVRFMALYFDFGAQVARENIAQTKDFSSHTHSWTQMDGLAQRHLFGFLDIHDALSQLYKTFTSLQPYWVQLASELYERHKEDFTVDIEKIKTSLLLFNPVPGGSLLYPTRAEREHIGLPPPEDDPCKLYVSPYSPIMKPLLVDNVLVIRR